MVGFGYCNNCEMSYSNKYYNNNKNNNNNYYYAYYHKSPLCSAAYHYSERCGWGCRSAANKAAKTGYNPYYNGNNNGANGNGNRGYYNGNGNGNRGYYNGANGYNGYNGYNGGTRNYNSYDDDGFSPLGVAFLWILSITG